MLSIKAVLTRFRSFQEPAASAAWANKNDKDTGNDDKEGGRDGAGKILYELNGQSLEIPLHAADCDLRNFPHKVGRSSVFYQFKSTCIHVYILLQG